MAGDRSDEDDNNNIILPLSIYRLQMSDPTRYYTRRSGRASMSFPQCPGEVVTASGTLERAHTHTPVYGYAV